MFKFNNLPLLLLDNYKNVTAINRKMLFKPSIKNKVVKEPESLPPFTEPISD